MRFCGTFCRSEQLGRPKQRPQPDAEARERVRPALLAVDHADRRAALETGLPQGLDASTARPAGGDDVLDEADALARLEDALEPVGRAVLLRLLADDQERQARRERRRGGERDCAELGAGEARRRRARARATAAAIRSPSGPSRSGRVSKRYLSR